MTNFTITICYYIFKYTFRKVFTMNIQKLNTKINIGKNVIRFPKLSDIFPCFILFLAGRTSVIGLFPFGLSMFCAVFEKNVSYIGIISLVFAGISAGCGLWTYKYAMGAIFFWLYTRLNEEYRKKALTSSVISALCLFLGGLILNLYYPTGLYDFLTTCVESVLCAFFYTVFDKASSLLTYSREGCGEQELICAALCIGIFITGVNDINFPPGINLSSLLTMYAIMSISMHEGLAVSGCGGLAAGFICSMSSNNAITLMGFFGLCAISANLLSSFSKYGTALGFLGGAAVTLMYIGNAFAIPVSVFEIGICMLLFILTPDSIHKKISFFLKRTLHPEIIPEAVRMCEYLSERLMRASDTFSALKETVTACSDKRLKFYNKDMCSIFDEVTDRVCRKCSNCGKCFSENKNNSYRIIFSILEITESKSFCTESNAPREFLALCKKPEVFLTEFSHVYELYKSEMINRGRDKASRNLLAQQYDEISSFFSELSDEIKEGFCFLPELEKQIADELTRAKISVREVKVLENADGICDIFVSSGRSTSPKLLEDKLSEILNLPIVFTESCSSSTLRFSPGSAFFTDLYTRQIPKSGQSINGDSLSFFSCENHTYYIVICDGMGTGEAAAQESKIAAKLTEIYLKSGFSPKTALNMINSSLILKSENEVFSSIDLLRLDLLTGTAEFYKIGGSKSFFHHDDVTETIFSDTLPVGIISEAHISVTSKKISDGDIIIMMSDGICDSSPGWLSGERIEKIIEKAPDDPENISSMIINSILKKKCGKAIDDMTIAAIKINSFK